MIFFNRDKYKLERAYELIVYLILNYGPKNSIDKHRIEGLEMARRALAEFLEGGKVEKIAKRVIKEKIYSYKMTQKCLYSHRCGECGFYISEK